MNYQFSTPEILRQAFPGMQQMEAEEMSAVGHVVTYPAQTVLCHEGSRETTFYIILEGEVEVTKVLNETETRVMKHLSPGGFFGEMAIIHNASRAATVTTTMPTTVLEIQKDGFSKFLERSSSLSIAMVREVSRRLRENDQMAIDDLRIKAQELAVAYQKLSDQEAARSEFLTIAAHELRTPLMAANGFVQVIRLGMLKGDALNSALDTVARNLQDIIAFTNDILFLQELEMIMPSFQPTDVGSAATHVVEQLRSRATANQVGLRLNIAPGLPLIQGDLKSLERALLSILDNAIKFSPDGGEVDTEVGCDGTRIWVKIQDHGVGIPSDALSHIFERYYHLENIGGRLFRGLGLGLAVSKAVIEQHGGSIEVESSLAEGSLFSIYLMR